MKTFPDFGKELKRPFEVDERCFDCAEFYHGCQARPENPDARCADRLRLPNVMPETTGQVLPSSRMQGRKEPRVRGGMASAAPGKHEQLPARLPEAIKGDARDIAGRAVGVSGKTKDRVCGCGAPLPKGRRRCDACRTQSRRQTQRDYMRTYMEQRRSLTSGSDSGVPFTHESTHATRACDEDRRLTGHPTGGARSDQTTVLTNAI